MKYGIATGVLILLTCSLANAEERGQDQSEVLEALKLALSELSTEPMTEVHLTVRDQDRALLHAVRQSLTKSRKLAEILKSQYPQQPTFAPDLMRCLGIWFEFDPARTRVQLHDGDATVIVDNRLVYGLSRSETGQWKLDVTRSLETTNEATARALPELVKIVEGTCDKALSLATEKRFASAEQAEHSVNQALWHVLTRDWPEAMQQKKLPPARDENFRVANALGAVTAIVPTSDGKGLLVASQRSRHYWSVLNPAKELAVDHETPMQVPLHRGIAMVRAAGDGKRVVRLTEEADVAALMNRRPTAASRDELFNGAVTRAVELIDIESMKLIWRAPASLEDVAVRISEDASKVLVAGVVGGRVIDSKTGKTIAELPNATLCATFTADGTALYVADPGGIITKYDLVKVVADPTTKPQRLLDTRLANFDNSVDMALSPDGRTLAVGTLRKVLIVDLNTMKATETPICSPSALSRTNSMVFSRDGRRLLLSTGVAASKPAEGFGVKVDSFGKAILIDLEQKRVQKFMQPHAGPVSQAIFFHDEKQVVTASLDGTVRLWNIETTPATTQATE